MNKFNSLRLLQVLTIFTTLISCSAKDPNFDAQRDIKNGKIHLISYGLSLPTSPPFTYIDKQADSLRTAYGFDIENRGCIADSAQLDKMKDYNKIVITHLSKRNGDHWYDQYQRQVDSLYSLTHQDIPK